VWVIAAAVALSTLRPHEPGQGRMDRSDEKREGMFTAQLTRAIGVAIVCVYLSVAHVAWATDELAFDLTVSSSGLGQTTVTGSVTLDDGKFDAFFSQNGVKLHLSGRVAGDAISIYGTIKTGYILTPCGFRADGEFKLGRFEQRYLTTSGAVDSYRGTIVMSRVVTGDAVGGTTGN